MTKFYLAHSFEDRLRIRAAEIFLESLYNVDLVNPFYDLSREHEGTLKDNQTREERIEELKRLNITPKMLVKRDLKAISESDGVIAILTNNSTIGTIMEIFYASTLKKNVYLVCENKDKIDHPWLRYCATKIFTSLTELERFIKKVYK